MSLLQYTCRYARACLQDVRFSDTPNLTTKMMKRQFSTGEFAEGKLVAGPVGWCQVRLPPKPGHYTELVDTTVPNLRLLPSKTPDPNAKPSAKPKGKTKAKAKAKAKAAYDSEEQDDEEGEEDEGNDDDDEEDGGKTKCAIRTYRQEDYKNKCQVGIRQRGHPKRQICTITHSTNKRYKVADALIKALEDGKVAEDDAKEFVASEMDKP